MELIVFEDEHLLVANKPAGWNTHSPSPFAGEGLYEWLKCRSRDRASLAILHRLDKETSGLIVFGKTPAANRSLARQFENHQVEKKYLLWTASRPAWGERRVRTDLLRAGEKYIVRRGQTAETIFRVVGGWRDGAILEAQPVTGRTHQIRVHAAEQGISVLGDRLYGGASWPRVCLHSARLVFEHPVSRQKISFLSEPQFTSDPRAALRGAIIDSAETDCWHVAHGAADGWPGLYIDKLGPYLLAQSASPLTESQRDFLKKSGGPVYHKILRQQGHAPPMHLWGQTAPGEFAIRENGLRFAVRLDEGYSFGLFLDQRDNRRRLMARYIAPGFDIAAPFELLNLFAYTCGFSVCAAFAGGRTTSVDLSKNYLAWGKRNFSLNNLDPAAHDFLFGEAFDWLRRLAKKRRLFDVIILDPPTFSRSRECGVFQAEKDFGKLAVAALPLLKANGILFASTNAAAFAPESFLDVLIAAVARSGRRIQQKYYVPQPPDFPISREEPAYLKTVWLRIA